MYFPVVWHIKSDFIVLLHHRQYVCNSMEWLMITYLIIWYLSVTYCSGDITLHHSTYNVGVNEPLNYYW